MITEDNEIKISIIDENQDKDKDSVVEELDMRGIEKEVKIMKTQREKLGKSMEEWLN